METYGQDFEKLKSAFVDFIEHLPFYGTAVVCLDDPNVQSILPRITKPIVTYGQHPDAEVRAVNVEAQNGKMRFGVEIRPSRQRPDARYLQIELNLPGIHNVLNALAAITVATEVGAPYPAMVKALKEFDGVGRRFQRFGELPLVSGGTFTLVDDYGHHPVEMAATLAAARGAFPGRRVVLAFQPHRYTRTRDLFEDFVQVLSSVDALYLADVYPAGEAPIVAADGRALARAIRLIGRIEPVFVNGPSDLPEAILSGLQDGDVVITMGAGSVAQVAPKLSERAQQHAGGQHA
jgi:UDP-N-acetylmuramate--alanine ligase